MKMKFVVLAGVCVVLATHGLMAVDAGGSAGWRMFDRRVGMFVHWGIYAVDGFHEQQRMRQKMGRADYERRAALFTAEKFSADAFVDAAESLGAEYIVVTAKHHDGFCLWDTKTTDFSVMHTPAKRDIIKELAETCRRRGMKLGLYYSNPDWHQVNAYNGLSTHQVPPEADDRPDLKRYRDYVKEQITELMTNYGDICCLFWDIPTHVDAPEMNELVRRLQPGIMIDDRGWGEGGDYSTPERGIPDGAAFARPTEACDSVGARSWGFRSNEDYRTAGYTTRSIDHILTMGGNYLLNVGPKADGTIPAEALSLLARTGKWYRRVKESYADVTTEPELVQRDGAMVTRRDNVVYLHYPKGLAMTGVNARPLKALPESAMLLNTGAALKTELVPFPDDALSPYLHVSGIPADDLANESVVIKLTFAQPPEEVLYETSKFVSGETRGVSDDVTHVRLVRSGDVLLVEFLLDNEDLDTYVKSQDRRQRVQEAYCAKRSVEFTFGGERECLHAAVGLDGRLWTNRHHNFRITRQQEGASCRIVVEVPISAVPRCVGEPQAFLAKFCRMGAHGSSLAPLLPGVPLDAAEGGALIRLGKPTQTAAYYRNGCDWPYGFRACWVKDFPRIVYEPNGGMTAGGFHIVNTNASEEVYFHNGKRADGDAGGQVDLPSLSMSFVSTIKVKGRGKFRFGFMPWTVDHICLYPYEKTSCDFTVDSPDEWREIRMGFTPEPDGVYAASGSNILPSLWVAAGSDIRVDDLEIRFFNDIVEQDEKLAAEPFPDGLRSSATPVAPVVPTMRGRFVSDEWKAARAEGNARFLRDGRMLYIAAETADRDLALALTGADGKPFALAVTKDGRASTPSKRPVYTFVNRAPDRRVVYRVAIPLDMVKPE